jgi:hypothetical protein
MHTIHSAPEPEAALPWKHLVARVAVALWAALGVLWLLDVGGGARLPLLHWLARGIAILAVLAAAGWVVAWAVGGWAAGGERRRATAAVAALVILALALRFTGISHEASGHYYLDEGTYYHHATAIAGGELLSRSFVYPHLTYYADAFVLWAAGLFPRAAARSADLMWGLAQPVDVAWVLLRSFVALLGALSVLPTFALGRRLGGLAGGLAGGLLIALSPLYNAGSHLNTCDVPAAFFAAVCLALAARLLERESARDYLLAGAAAGLAAGAKYPAGLVAVAIVAVWISWRLAPRPLPSSEHGSGRRGWLRGFGLLWAGLAAVAAFVATTPSLLAFPRAAFYGDKGIFFGVHQYGRHGWIGVLPRSNARFYLDNLVESFGWAALAAGGIGLVVLLMRDRARRRALLWLAPFPVVFWLLIADMNMVVKRNLYPLLPAVAAYLGAGLAAWLGLARGRPALRAAAALLAALCLVQPAIETARDDVGLARPTTRDEAVAWIRAHLPRGARIVKESYTPDLPPEEYAVEKIRFAGRLGEAELRAAGNDYLLLASDAYQRFLRPELTVKAHQRAIGERYRAILGGWRPIAQWIPSDTSLGPILKLYRLEPLAEDCRPNASLPAALAFTPDAAMRQPVPNETGPLRYGAAAGWAMVKACLPAGRYAVAVAGTVAGEGSLRVVDSAGSDVARVPLAAGRAVVALPRRDRYFFYLELGKGSELAEVEVGPAPQPPAP